MWQTQWCQQRTAWKVSYGSIYSVWQYKHCKILIKIEGKTKENRKPLIMIPCGGHAHRLWVAAASWSISLPLFPCVILVFPAPEGNLYWTQPQTIWWSKRILLSPFRNVNSQLTVSVPIFCYCVINLICSNRDGPRNYHAEWSRSDRERQISYGIIYMWNLKKRYKWTYLQNSNRPTDIENKLRVTKWETCGGTGIN